MNKKSLENFVRKVEDNTNEALLDSLADEEYVKPDIKYNDIASNSAQDVMKKVPWLLVIFLVLIFSIILVNKFLNSNPQTIFTMAIDKFFDSVTENLSDNPYTISKGKVDVSLDLSNDGKYKDLFSDISKNDYTFDYVFDISNKLSFIKFFLDCDGDLEKGYYYSGNGHSYVYFDGIYDKYIKLDELKPIRGVRNSDIKIILNGVNQAVDKVTTSEKIIGSRTGIDLGTKTLKVYEATLVIDEKNYDTVVNNFVNSFRSNNEFIQIISKISSKSSEDVNKLFDKLATNIKQFLRENGTTNIKLFIDRSNNKFVEMNLTGSRVSFSLKEKDSYYEFDFSDSKDDIKFSGSIQYKEVNKKTNNVNLIFKFAKSGENTLGNIDIVFSNIKANSFPKVNIKNYVNESDLSDEEKAAIYVRLLSKPNYKWGNYFIK